MSNLSQETCKPYQDNSVKLEKTAITEYLAALPLWSLKVTDGIAHIERDFQFKNFSEALDFTYSIGNLSDACNHHPTIITQWGKVTLCWWTHKVQGLHKNDFIMAAKSDETYNRLDP